MASTETKIIKQGAARKIRDITLTIPETFGIIRKPEIATSQSILWQHMTRILDKL
jgi:hypothetical protein